ncbi:MAG: hypothetical protein GWP16_00625 [Nitrospirae bacterium]|nr:hypothetical protein [Nitrospirota bacterium]
MTGTRLDTRSQFSRLMTLAFTVILFSLSNTASGDAVTLRGIVDTGGLGQSPNSVVLEFLLNEGNGVLPADLQDEAVEQLVDSLRSQTLIDPLEGMGQMMERFMNPMGMMKQGMKQQFNPENLARSYLGARPKENSAQQQEMMQEMESIMIDPWVRGMEAASVLQSNGYTEDAARFYRGCLTSIGSVGSAASKHDWVQDRCIEGALAMGPEEAGALFAELYDSPYMDLGIDFSAFGAEAPQMPVMPQVQAVAAKGLGKLVGTGTLTPEQRTGVMNAIVGITETRNQDSVALIGAIQGLSFANDRQAVDPLRKLWKKGKPEEIRPVAMGGLVVGYREGDAITAMRKELKTGQGIGRSIKKAKSFAPWTGQGQEPSPTDKKGRNLAEARYLAGRALIQASDPSGYEWASKYLDKRTVPRGERDFRPDLVRDLVETGGAEARKTLQVNVDDGHQNEWLAAWMRIALFELGDRGQLDELAKLTDKSDWDFGRGTAGRWYKRFKPLLWEGAKMAMGLPPDEEALRRMVADFAFAERDRISARGSERDVRTGQFRWQLAAAMAEVDDPTCLPVIRALLEDEDSSVRLSAAYSLLGQSSSGTSDLLLQASQLDYGSEDDASRNPEVRAALLRRMTRIFPDDPATAQAMKRATGAGAPSLQFMAMTAQLVLNQTATASRSGS